MVFIVISIILFILLLAVSTRLAIIKKELRRIAAHMSEEDCEPVSVQMIDEDLSELITGINRAYEKQLDIKSKEGRYQFFFLQKKGKRNKVPNI